MNKSCGEGEPDMNDFRIPLRRALSPLLVFLASSVLALAQSDPWTTSATALKTAFTGPIATALIAVAVVVTGMVFASKARMPGSRCAVASPSNGASPCGSKSMRKKPRPTSSRHAAIRSRGEYVLVENRNTVAVSCAISL